MLKSTLIISFNIEIAQTQATQEVFFLSELDTTDPCLMTSFVPVPRPYANTFMGRNNPQIFHFDALVSVVIFLFPNIKSSAASESKEATCTEISNPGVSSLESLFYSFISSS